MLVPHAASEALVPLGDQYHTHSPLYEGFTDAAAKANCSLVQIYFEDVLLKFVEKYYINHIPALANVRKTILELVNASVSLSLSPHLAVSCSALTAAVYFDAQRKPSQISNGPVSFFVMHSDLQLPQSSDRSISGLCACSKRLPID